MSTQDIFDAFVNTINFLFPWLDNLDTKDWVQIISTIALGIIAFESPKYIEKWRNKHYSPKVLIQFKLEPPYCHLTHTTTLINVFYFRIGVRNVGRTQAEDCEVTLDSIQEKVANGEFTPIVNFSPVNLKWSGIDYIKSKTIQPGREIHCDLGKIYQILDIPEAQQFIFEQMEVYNSQPHSLKAGEYKIKLSVYASNAPKTTREFTLRWSGRWESNETEMFKEIIIQ